MHLTIVSIDPLFDGNKTRTQAMQVDPVSGIT